MYCPSQDRISIGNRRFHNEVQALQEEHDNMSAVNPAVAGKAQDGVKPWKCCKILWLMNVKYGEPCINLCFRVLKSWLWDVRSQFLNLLQPHVCYKSCSKCTVFGSISQAPFTPRKLSSVQAELWVDVLTELTLMVYVVKDLIFVSCSRMNGWGSRFRLVVWWIGLIGSPCSCNQVAQSIAIVCHTQKRMLTAGHTLFWCIICIHWSIII